MFGGACGLVDSGGGCDRHLKVEMKKASVRADWFQPLPQRKGVSHDDRSHTDVIRRFGSAQDQCVLWDQRFRGQADLPTTLARRAADDLAGARSVSSASESGGGGDRKSVVEGKSGD